MQEFLLSRGGVYEPEAVKSMCSQISMASQAEPLYMYSESVTHVEGLLQLTCGTNQKKVHTFRCVEYSERSTSEINLRDFVSFEYLSDNKVYHTLL